MILSDECWMKSYCPKYNSIKSECECRNTNSFCSKLFKLDKLFEFSLLPNSQREHLTLRIDSNGDDRQVFIRLKEIEKEIENWVKNGNNLYIYSQICGNGKTSWAVRLIQSYLESIWYKSDLETKALFINVPRFLLALKSNISEKNEYAEHIKETVLDTDLVVWDDVAIKTATVYEMENLLSILDYRLSAKKSNIYTSNLNGEELQERIGERLYSRIINLSEVVEFIGQDKRGLIK